MFSDYLFQLVNDNLVTDTSIFPDITTDDLNRAVEYIKDKRPVSNDLESVIARFLFAKTLKQLLEDPESELSVRLESTPALRNTLKTEYLSSINAINEHFGRRVVAPMPGPFIVPELTPITGTITIKLGEGAYANVYATRKGYAIKKPVYGLDATTLREVSILRYLDHPNVVNLTNMELDPPRIAMPLAQGTLKEKLDLGERKWFFYQLFRGIAYCHSKYVWHRDLKPLNILMFKENDVEVAKIADFGLAAPYIKKGNNDINVATMWWRAPEILLGDQSYTELIDVWSLGVMLMDSVTGENTFKTDSETEQTYAIFRALGTPTEEVWPGVDSLEGGGLLEKDVEQTTDEPYNSILQEMDPEEQEVILHTVTWPSQRYSALDILKLPYFDDVRDKVETVIPAEPITNRECGLLMLEDQVKLLPPPDGSEYETKHNRIVFGWLYEVKYKLSLGYKSFFYGQMLMNIYIGNNSIETQNIQLYGIAAMHIASEMFEGMAPEDTDWLWVAAKKYDRTQFEKAVRDILTVRDFDMIIPSCYNFIDEYTRDEQYTKDQLETIMFHAFILLLNYDFALQYTTSQIAQAAIEIVGVSPKCLLNTEKVYNQNMYDYLNSFDPQSDMKFFLTKQPIILTKPN